MAIQLSYRCRRAFAIAGTDQLGVPQGLDAPTSATVVQAQRGCWRPRGIVLEGHVSAASMHPKGCRYISRCMARDGRRGHRFLIRRHGTKGTVVSSRLILCFFRVCSSYFLATHRLPLPGMDAILPTLAYSKAQIDSCPEQFCSRPEMRPSCVSNIRPHGVESRPD